MEWKRELFEWEVDEVNNLMHLINEKALVKGVGDYWLWKPDEKLEYTVSSAYKTLKTEKEWELRSLYEFFWSIKALPSKTNMHTHIYIEHVHAFMHPLLACACCILCENAD